MLRLAVYRNTKATKPTNLSLVHRNTAIRKLGASSFFIDIS